MSWNTEAQQVMKDCEHAGNCPCRPEECEVCKGTGMVLAIRHRPLLWVHALGADKDAPPVIMSQVEASKLGGYIEAWLIGSEEGEEMTCPECHGEGSLS